MVVVTGATGQFGRAVIEKLLMRVPANQLGVSVRAPEKVINLAEKGVRVRRGDFDDPKSLANSFEGASRVLVISVGTAGERAVHLHAQAVQAAQNAQGLSSTPAIWAPDRIPRSPRCSTITLPRRCLRIAGWRSHRYAMASTLPTPYT